MMTQEQLKNCRAAWFAYKAEQKIRQPERVCSVQDFVRGYMMAVEITTPKLAQDLPPS